VHHDRAPGRAAKALAPGAGTLATLAKLVSVALQLYPAHGLDAFCVGRALWQAGSRKQSLSPGTVARYAQVLLKISAESAARIGWLSLPLMLRVVSGMQTSL
jgi:hypothetical protein